MPGTLSDESVIIKDQKEGSQLYNRGNYGCPMSGGGLELDLFEATYLLESDRLVIEDDGRMITFEDIFNYSSKTLVDFDIKYIVYRDLRSRGFVVRAESGTFDLSVFPRGMTLSNSRPVYLVRAVSERLAFDIDTFTDEVSQTEDKGKQLLYGVVDEEGDITYYIMSHRNPTGKAENKPVKKEVVGRLNHDRVFIFDEDDSYNIRKNGYYGKVVGNMLQLSLIESYYLMERKELSVIDENGDSVSLKELMKTAEGQDEFTLRLKAFSDMRDKGLVVKTGFKYGTHFRVYEGSPDKCHARYLVHSVDAASKTLWPEISRAVRLAGGVKKEFLFCRIGKKVEYLEFKWFRP